MTSERNTDIFYDNLNIEVLTKQNVIPNYLLSCFYVDTERRVTTFISSICLSAVLSADKRQST